MPSATAPLRRALKGKAPGLRVERELWDAGVDTVAGVDEVGRGSWAGPLTVAAVVPNSRTRIYKVRDSKMLTPAERDVLHDRILAWARAASVGHATVEECTALGMAGAQRLAARRAIDGLGLSVDHVLVDGAWDFVSATDTVGPNSANGSAEPAAGDAGCRAARRGVLAGANSSAEPAAGDAANTAADHGHPRMGVTTIVRGDATSLSIAAASVVAKVTRDRIMISAAEIYPAYWFASNKGYPCPRHVAALAARGPCAIHRRRWAFMDGLRWTGVPREVAEPDTADDGQRRLFRREGPAERPAVRGSLRVPWASP